MRFSHFGPPVRSHTLAGDHGKGRTMHTNRIAAAAAMTVIFGGASALAAPVGPGEMITTNLEVDAINPAGNLVDEEVRTVTFQYVPPEGHGFQNPEATVVDVTFRSQVYATRQHSASASFTCGRARRTTLGAKAASRASPPSPTSAPMSSPN